MKTLLSLLLGFLFLCGFSRPASATDYIFTGSAAADNGRLSVFILNDRQELAVLRTTVKRDASQKIVALDLDAGYLLSCGGWRTESGGKIAGTYKLLEAWKYAAPTEARTAVSYVYDMSGETWGPFRKILASGDTKLAAAPELQIPAERLKGIWLACREAGRPQSPGLIRKN